MMDSYDCVVVGGGPAGTAAATLVAEAGYSTLLAERQRVPRCHVGESLMPECRGVLERLGVLEAVQQHGFGKKTGVQFVSADGGVSQSFFFQERDASESSLAWNVERAAFDRLLFENARSRGAVCLDQTVVLDVLMEGDCVQGVKLTLEEGKPCLVRCRVLIDATGQQALLGTRLGLVRRDSELPGAAIWGYYRNARRETGPHAGATVLLHTTDKSSWFWCIPLADEFSSIGVVGKHATLLQGKGKLPDVFEDQLVKCPALIERLINAELVGVFHAVEHIAYSVARRAGEGWVLVGDAGGVADPLFGSGVLFALTSGAWAADSVIEGLRTNDLSAAQLGSWSDRFEGGVQTIRDLARLFLSPQFSCGQLVSWRADQKSRLTDLLMGRLFHNDEFSMSGETDSWFRISAAHQSAASSSSGPRAAPARSDIPRVE
jgi:flavin-dependent dehydrogenase